MNDNPNRASSGASTPPNEPTWQVHLSDTHIRYIVTSALPGATYVSSRQLPRGSSFNNRLYVVSVVYSTDGRNANPSLSTTEEELILKVCGRFWRCDKTRNEVSCLKLVRRHCANVPVPRVIAWCDDADATDGVGREWILMTKVQGVVLNDVAAGAGSEVLDEGELEALMESLARMLVECRDCVPGPGMIGNLVGELDESGCAEVGGSVDVPGAKGAPWRSYLAYYRSVFIAHVRQLQELEVLKPNRYLIGELSSFINHDLGRLSIFGDSRSSQSVLSHMDISPRNILVARNNNSSGSKNQTNAPYVITGLVDWEFSGFFSPFDEQLSIAEEMGEITGKGDPSACSARAMLFSHFDEVEARSERGTVVRDHRYVAELLLQLKEHIAPWWLRERNDIEEVREELDKAALVVQETLRKVLDTIDK